MSTTTGRPANMHESHLAFQAIYSELLAMEPERVLVPRVNLTRAATTAMGAFNKLSFLRASLGELPFFDATAYDQLRTTAMAVVYAASKAKIESANERRVAELVEQARPLRELMLKTADIAVLLGIFDETDVSEIRQSRSFADIAADMVQLSAMYHQAWDELCGRIPLEASDVEWAGELGDSILAAIADGEVDDEQVDTDLRNRAYTLLVERYREVRRGVAFLREYEGDAGDLCPSFYLRRRSPRGVTEAPSAEPSSTLGSTSVSTTQAN